MLVSAAYFLGVLNQKPHLQRPCFVGKSCLLDRFINGLFEGHPRNTIGAAFAAKKVWSPCTINRLLVGATLNMQHSFAVSFFTCTTAIITQILLWWQVTVQNGRIISLGVWDTAGAERFQSISRTYYRGSRAAIVCFTPISQESFRKALFWVSKAII